MKRRVILLLLILCSLPLRGTAGEPDYLGMVGQIETALQDAVRLYKDGEADEAKQKVQGAYFEIFENLEGPIRINISAKKNYELESEFGAIRKMFAAGESVEVIEDRADRFVAALRATVGQVIGGYSLVASSEAGRQKETEVRDWQQVSVELFAQIDAALALYRARSYAEARTKVQDAYFDVFEASGMELALGMRSERYKTAIEGHFSRLAAEMGKSSGANPVATSEQALREDVAIAVNILSKKADTPLSLFLQSLTIILREGMEAILILSAIIAYLVKTGHRDKLKVIYRGAIAALGASAVTAVLLKWVFRVSAKHQELLEGATLLLAAAVLFFVSYWLISKLEAQKWVSYIHGKVGNSLERKSLKALWFAAFLAVYREGAETLLFYQAMFADSGASGATAIASGFVSGGLLLVAIYWIMRYGALKLPLKPFFAVTGILLYYLAFVFIGKGVMEFVEGGLLSPSPVSWLPQVPTLGIYSYWETWIPQMGLILLAAFAFVYARRGERVKSQSVN